MGPTWSLQALYTQRLHGSNPNLTDSPTRCCAVFMTEGVIIHLLLCAECPNIPLVTGLVKVWLMWQVLESLVCLPPHEAHCFTNTSNVLAPYCSSRPISMSSTECISMPFGAFRWTWSQTSTEYASWWSSGAKSDLWCLFLVDVSHFWFSKKEDINHINGYIPCIWSQVNQF